MHILSSLKSTYSSRKSVLSARRRGQTIVLSALCAGTVFYAVPSRADNIALQGRGILGINNAIDNDAGTLQFHAGDATAITDGDPGTHVDNYFPPPGDHGITNSFVGVLWPARRYDKINNLTLTLALFNDGGWFGASNKGPAAGGPLTAAQVIEPAVQVSTDYGVTWTNVPFSSDYAAVMTGQMVGGGGQPNPNNAVTTFTFAAPVTGVNGIRIIGQNGGVADRNGFIGVAELEVNADLDADNDGDGLPDGWETANGLNKALNDADADPDADGLVNSQEYANGTNPHVADSDGDGLSDNDELNLYFTNPILADTDGDGLSDGRELNEVHSDPNIVDSDSDGLSDGDEVLKYHSNPALTESDGDGFPDGVEVTLGSDPANPNNFPDNLAIIGTGLMGTKPSLDSGVETETELYHAGTAQAINDVNPTTRVDTFNGNADQVSFVGIRWDHQITTPIVNLELTLATFLDGGWFGVNGKSPAAGGALTTNHLTEPNIEITRDSGATWTAVPHSSDYLTALRGHIIGGGPAGNPTYVTAKFTLTTPVTNIDGIRIIGTEGGSASGGFIGVSELAVRGSVTDADNDGMDDGWEREHGLNPAANDAAGDPDADGLTNLEEFKANTDPQIADSDADGLNDGPEVHQYHTNPLGPDSDADGLSDGTEANTSHSDPLLKDTDGDGFPDGFEVAQGSDPASAASTPSNIASLGRGILGTKETVDIGIETPLFNSGSAESINDGNLTTRVDSFGGGADTASFVGILWNSPVTNPVVSLDLTLATFFDGGWFGQNNLGPGSGGMLTAAEHLIEPKVQVTIDGGTNWMDAAATSDYLTALDGHPLPDADYGPPTTATAHFQLSEPRSGINGIRLIGPEGGTASGGFLGVFELAVNVNRGTNSSGGIVLANHARVSGQMHFEFDSKPGVTYTVQYKDKLDNAAWQTLTTVQGTGTKAEVNDTGTGSSRFYRVLSP